MEQLTNTGSVLTLADGSTNAYFVSSAPQTDYKKLQIVITPKSSGYLVQVGCQEFAITGLHTLIHQLNTFLNNPDKVGSEWMTENKLP